MTDAEQTGSWIPEPAAAAPAPSAPAPAPAAPESDGAAGATMNDRPEVPVAAAFAAGFLFALLLRRLAR
ncbi:MAG TPA: hypothetical protein VGF81_12015 [Solirubrobacteraceae bacterium]